MLDCSKKFSELSPYEAWQCFKNAEDWRIISGNLGRMWEGFLGTTIGEWSELVFGVAMLVAIAASYLLPLRFLGKWINRHTSRLHFAGNERARRARWSIFLMLVGAGMLVFLPANEPFWRYQGTWQILCGIAAFVVNAKWWAKQEQVRSF